MSRSTRKLLLPGGIVLALVTVLLLAPLLPLHDVRAMDIPNRFAGPSAAHWLGQDEFGRDVLARLIWGGRASLFIAVGSALAAATIGTLLGLLGGYFRGVVEVLTVRAAEVLLCLPPLLLALLVVTILGAGTWPLILALTLLYTPNYARVAYAATLQVRGLDYVTAQRAMGAPPLTILGRTILPNVLPPLLVQMSLVVASAMVIESGLSFLGLGVVPPTPSWGLMIRAARGAMEQAPMLLVWPSLALAGTILTFNLLCDRLQTALDPREVTKGGALWMRRPGRRKTAAARRPGAADDNGPLVEIRNLAISVGRTPQIDLVRRAGLTVMPGETVALVGESGSGKTLTSLALLGLLPDQLRVSAGEMRYRTRAGAVLDLAQMDEEAFRALRGPEVSMVFQDAAAALNPVHRVGDQLAEALRAGGLTGERAVQARVVELLRHVGIPDPERRRRAYPHELSGGQRQRAMIALAVANSPRLLVADEPTTALDPTIQAQILDLFRKLKTDTPDMGLIFVTHDLAVVSELADRVVVMYAGEVVETGPVAEVFARPKHPYTAALIASVPEGAADQLRAIPGSVPPPHDMPPGCRFAPRCDHALPQCTSRVPETSHPEASRSSRCIRWKEVC
ncbi:dipeptide/oligopeptide/nickel ABC transporter permease/ATP-binding protein [Marinovum sp. SP66]|uniref:dipeptide/oligopeptide/nickel ABC transporter permease/ATP-binding protein n=1 Tax=Marinovum TaxID=367771 RepID=UPI00237AD87B|nr:dipeptide/oligopeptide/nickel ABC transporter permease/ATP-binding protein [Marinovum sp. SP66]MDD9740922.1 dipeptide/oligopeptide/nickel ABC transporter permease/ATP-binding protein [Marinovum sp. SP66]